MKKREWLWVGVSIVILIGALLICVNETGDKIAVIPIHGEILVDGGTKIGFSSYTSSGEIVQKIKEANEDPFIKAIILDINSPGGTFVAAQDVSEAVKESKKPVVAWLREIATSGAYFIASSSDKIIASPATLTGSVGVSGSYLEFSGLMEKYGIKYERLVSGEYKDTGSPFRELRPEEREKLQQNINRINQLFLEHVAKERNLSEEQINRISTGEVFIGIEAKELGLIDILGGEKEAKETAEKLAKIRNAEMLYYKKEKGFWESLFEILSVQNYLFLGFPATNLGIIA